MSPTKIFYLPQCKKVTEAKFPTNGEKQGPNRGFKQDGADKTI